MIQEEFRAVKCPRTLSGSDVENSYFVYVFGDDFLTDISSR